jgi:polyisoprenoid-binding protein YceI
MNRLAAAVLALAFFSPASLAAGSVDIPSGVYAIDKGHTYVSFSYLHQGLSYPLLRAVDVDGELELDAGNLEASAVAITIAADSIRSNVDYFDEELASPKFFNAAKFPHIRFVADNLELSSDSQGLLKGQVTIRGITRPLELAVTINGAMENPLSGKPVIGVSASGELKRSDFQLDRFIPAVSDRVGIQIEAEFAEGSNEGSAAAANIARGERAAAGD